MTYRLHGKKMSLLIRPFILRLTADHASQVCLCESMSVIISDGIEADLWSFLSHSLIRTHGAMACLLLRVKFY